MHTSIEFKARCSDPEKIRQILEYESADYKGKDHQIDVYFNSPNGRLKLRKGKIENYLIYYKREDKKGPKQSNVILFKMQAGTNLELLLSNALGVKAIVDKQRDIYFIGNVKFHIDKVKNLGSFVEVEALDYKGITGKSELRRQCSYYLAKLEIARKDLVSVSYSDLLQKKSNNLKKP